MKKRIYKDLLCTIELMYKRKVKKASKLLYQGNVNLYLRELIEASELRQMQNEFISLAS
jgi:hypothetical protein